MPLLKIPTCPICHFPATLVTGKEIYPRRPDLYGRKFYRCDEHRNHYVGTHKSDGSPLGILAGPELRVWKSKCHALFDSFWMGKDTLRAKRFNRVKHYSRLAQEMEITMEEAHFGMFTVEQCKKAYEIIQKWKN